MTQHSKTRPLACFKNEVFFLCFFFLFCFVFVLFIKHGWSLRMLRHESQDLSRVSLQLSACGNYSLQKLCPLDCFVVLKRCCLISYGSDMNWKYSNCCAFVCSVHNVGIFRAKIDFLYQSLTFRSAFCTTRIDGQEFRVRNFAGSGFDPLDGGWATQNRKMLPPLGWTTFFFHSAFGANLEYLEFLGDRLFFKLFVHEWSIGLPPSPRNGRGNTHFEKRVKNFRRMQ